MNRLRQIFHAKFGVARIFFNKLWKHFDQRLIFVIQIFELLQLSDQTIPSTFGNADCENHEQRIQTDFFDDQTIVGEIIRDQCCRNAGFLKRTVNIQTGHQNRGFDRIKNIHVRFNRAKAMPRFVGLEHPIILCANTFRRQSRRFPHTEPPRIAVIAVFLTDFAHRMAEIQGFIQTVVGQRDTADAFHHRRRHITRGNDGVLRAGRGVHQIRFVEVVTIQRFFDRVLHQDL